jgi:hypothetical protein
MKINFITRFFQCLAQTNPIQRFEFLLPLKYNDGTEIEPDKFNQTARQLTDRFQGLCQDLTRVHGAWRFYGTIYFDELMRLRVDTRDPKARAFFKTQKEIWKERFQQLDLWITVHEIEVI